jgi:hypothetical protein
MCALLLRLQRGVCWQESRGGRTRAPPAVAGRAMRPRCSIARWGRGRRRRGRRRRSRWGTCCHDDDPARHHGAVNRAVILVGARCREGELVGLPGPALDCAAGKARRAHGLNAVRQSLRGSPGPGHAPINGHGVHCRVGRPIVSAGEEDVSHNDRRGGARWWSWGSAGWWGGSSPWRWGIRCGSRIATAGKQICSQHAAQQKHRNVTHVLISILSIGDGPPGGHQGRFRPRIGASILTTELSHIFPLGWRTPSSYITPRSSPQRQTRCQSQMHEWNDLSRLP